MKDLVSIITASYNAEKYIAEAIKSVQAQTYSHWEMLITDDASTDQTRRIIETFVEADKRIKLFKFNENQGPAKARNHSIAESKGKFIAFLDADDQWLPEKLSLQLKVLKQNKSSVCFSSYTHIDKDGNDLNRMVSAIPRLSYKKLLKNNYIGNLTGMYDASVLGKIYNPELKKRQDWCLWLEALKRSEKPALGFQKPLAKYRVLQDSISSHKFQLLKYNFWVYRKYLRFSFIKSSFYLLIFLKEYFFIRPKYISKQ